MSGSRRSKSVSLLSGGAAAQDADEELVAEIEKEGGRRRNPVWLRSGVTGAMAEVRS